MRSSQDRWNKKWSSLIDSRQRKGWRPSMDFASKEQSILNVPRLKISRPLGIFSSRMMKSRNICEGSWNRNSWSRKNRETIDCSACTRKTSEFSKKSNNPTCNSTTCGYPSWWSSKTAKRFSLTARDNSPDHLIASSLLHSANKQHNWLQFEIIIILSCRSLNIDSYLLEGLLDLAQVWFTAVVQLQQGALG
jgi:hypothetical protein